VINNILSVFIAIIITSPIEAVFGAFPAVLQFATECSDASINTVYLGMELLFYLKLLTSPKTGSINDRS
jgi:hypothetical protein